MDCPICGFSVADRRGLAAHFRHQSKTHPNYTQWNEELKFKGQVEDQDYVRCRVCEHRANTLAGHLTAAHQITAEQYRESYPNALIRATSLTVKRQKAAKNRSGGFGKGDTKKVTCPDCGREWEGSKFLVPGTHDLRCEGCREAAKESRWTGLTEPDDYVTCLDCGHRAESLTSHIRANHLNYRTRHPQSVVVALGSAVRDKTALRGRTLSEETKHKMSENAGRWNKGLTKETHPSLAIISEKMMGRASWNSGLTAETDPRMAETARKLQMYVGDERPWDNGLAAGLTLGDFRPFMDAEGRVDHHRVVEATGVSWLTVRKYIVDLGLEQTRQYTEAAAEEATIRLDQKLLEQFRLGNGKVSIGKAMSVTGHSFSVIKRECGRHGLPTFHRHIRQTLCLDAVSKALGGTPYRMEWESLRFVNPPTGHRFRFDGYFQEVGFIVEFQGHQHYTFPNAFMYKDSHFAKYEALRERDKVKRALIEAAPDLTYFEIREDEPFTDVSYLKGRLVQLGVLNFGASTYA